MMVAADFKEFDVVLVMDSSNFEDVIALARNGEERSKVLFFMQDGSDVPDPYYGGNDGFDQVHRMLKSAFETWGMSWTEN